MTAGRSLKRFNVRAAVENGTLFAGLLFIGHGLYQWYPPAMEMFVGACAVGLSVLISGEKGK